MQDIRSYIRVVGTKLCTLTSSSGLFLSGLTICYLLHLCWDKYLITQFLILIMSIHMNQKEPVSPHSPLSLTNHCFLFLAVTRIIIYRTFKNERIQILTYLIVQILVKQLKQIIVTRH